MTTKQLIENIVQIHLETASIDYLYDIVSHGIHNLTNEFNADSEQVYFTYDQEFRRQAQDLIDKMCEHN